MHLVSHISQLTPLLIDILYQGKYDKNAKNGEAAFKLYNFAVNAQPKSCIVSFILQLKDTHTLFESHP